MATSKVELLLKVNGTRLGIFQDRLLITYSLSFSSASDCVSGSMSDIGALSFLPRGLCVMVTACNAFSPCCWFLEFFASLTEAHTQKYC